MFCLFVGQIDVYVCMYMIIISVTYIHTYILFAHTKTIKNPLKRTNTTNIYIWVYFATKQSYTMTKEKLKTITKSRLHNTLKVSKTQNSPLTLCTTKLFIQTAFYIQMQWSGQQGTYVTYSCPIIRATTDNSINVTFQKGWKVNNVNTTPKSWKCRVILAGRQSTSGLEGGDSVSNLQKGRQKRPRQLPTSLTDISSVQGFGICY